MGSKDIFESFRFGFELIIHYEVLFYASAIIISLFFVSCSGFRKSQRKAEANKIIVKIDNFKSRTQRLPESLSEIDTVEDEKGPIYYQKVDYTDYVVWFGRELGESTTYHSATNQWEP